MLIERPNTVAGLVEKQREIGGEIEPPASGSTGYEGGSARTIRGGRRSLTMVARAARNEPSLRG
jgi:hypothetical protein